MQLVSLTLCHKRVCNFEIEILIISKHAIKSNEGVSISLLLAIETFNKLLINDFLMGIRLREQSEEEIYCLRSRNQNESDWSKRRVLWQVKCNNYWM